MQGNYTFMTVGAKHIKFWYPEEKRNEKGLFGNNESTSFACCAYDEQGIAYSGGTNGMIYVWKGRNVDATIPVH